jgi:putative DNA primase/helicase
MDEVIEGPGLAPIEGDGSEGSESTTESLNHADNAKEFLAGNKDFYRVYDVPGQPTASWMGSRYVISDDTSPLRAAVRDFLNVLYDSLPATKKGRAKLKSAAYCRDVTAEVIIKLPPIRKAAFDAHEYVLYVAGDVAVNLTTAEEYTARREDFITQRLYIAPDYSTPASRFDRFMDEITLGNPELKRFLLRLMAICLTAHPYQGLFFFWGKGRNGKGVLLRLLSRILGSTFTCTFRPNELTASKYNEDKAMRSFNKLEGKRLATIDESVGSNLNYPILKLMSGGDALSAARMRQDERQFSPTHKCIFPTNEKPELPNDPAFRGRTFFVPFLADYSDRAKQDSMLEITLAAEAPSILGQLIKLCPDVIANGLQPPKIVTDATTELLEENDLAAQFKADMLTDAPGKTVSLDDMGAAIQTWLSGSATAGLSARSSYRNADQTEKILSELKGKYVCKRLRPEGRSGRRVLHFIDVDLIVENS